MDLTKVRGALIGSAIADAVGLTNRFIWRATPQTYPYDTPIRKNPLNDWTENTDCAILIARSCGAILRTYAESPQTQQMTNFSREFGVRLDAWTRNGFGELGDDIGIESKFLTIIAKRIDENTSNAVDAQQLIDPFAAALVFWEESHHNFATNAPLGRSTPLCAVDDARRIALVIAGCRTTHADPKCVAACLIHTTLCALLVRGTPIAHILTETIKCLGALDSTIATPLSPDEMLELSAVIKRAYTQSIESFELGALSRIEHVYNALSCSIWTLQVIRVAESARSVPDFKLIIVHVAAQGGDASANCAAAGAVLGAYLGAGALPREWMVAAPNMEWLERQYDTFLDIVMRVPVVEYVDYAATTTL